MNDFRSRAQADDDGERTRLRHAIDRVAATIASLRLAVEGDYPIGHDGPQALAQSAYEVVAHCAAADAYRRAAR